MIPDPLRRRIRESLANRRLSLRLEAAEGSFACLSMPVEEAPTATAFEPRWAAR
jgi:hypothetical protein